MIDGNAPTNKIKKLKKKIIKIKKITIMYTHTLVYMTH